MQAFRGTKNQQFKVVWLQNGWYSVTPFSNGKVSLSPFSDKPKSGVTVNVYAKDNYDNTQGWKFAQDGDYVVILSTYDNSLALTAEANGNG